MNWLTTCWLTIGLPVTYTGYLHRIPINRLPIPATYTGYLYGLPVWATCTGYLYRLLIPATYTGYLYWLPIWATYTGYLYGLPICAIYTGCSLHMTATGLVCDSYYYYIIGDIPNVDATVFIEWPVNTERLQNYIY